MTEVSAEAQVGGFFQVGVVDSLGRNLIPIVLVAEGQRRTLGGSLAPTQADAVAAAAAALDSLGELSGRIATCSNLDKARPLVAERQAAVAAAERLLEDAITDQLHTCDRLRMSLADLVQQRRGAEELIARIGIQERLHSATDVKAALSNFRRYFETRPRARGAGPLIGPVLTEVVQDLRQLSLDDAGMYRSMLCGEEVDPADCESRLRTRQALLLELHARLDAAEDAAYVLGSSVLQWLQEQEQQRQHEVRVAEELHKALQAKQELLKRSVEDEQKAKTGLSELRALKKDQIKLQTRLNAARNDLSEALALDELSDEADADAGDQPRGNDTPGRPSISSMHAAVEAIEREHSSIDRQHQQLVASLRELVQTVPQLRLNSLIASVPSGHRVGKDRTACALRVSRRIDSDYSEVAEAWIPVTQRAVFTARYRGEQVLLKAFAAGGDAEADIERELIVSQLRHPNIVEVEAVFFDPARCATYIQMAACPCGSFRQWALTGTAREPWKIQSAGAQVLHALSYLHSAGIVHRALSPDGVLMHSETGVRLTDFCWARGVDAAAGGVRDCTANPYAPPEIQESESVPDADASEDMWAFGALMFEAHWGTIPFLLPKADNVEVTGYPNARLVALLGLCLSRSPSARPSATDALVSSYFTVSLVHDLQEGREVSSSAKRIEAFYAFLEATRALEDTSSVKEITVDRSGVADFLLEHCGPSWIKRSFRVCFMGEVGADAAGLTTELFRLFFLQVASDESSAPLFVRGSGGTYLPRRRDSDEHDFSRLERLRAFGHVLAKCLLDGRSCPMRLAPSFLKVLLDQHATLTLRDLECFDPGIARQLQRLLVTRGYSELLDCTFEDLLPAGEERRVDETNKQGALLDRSMVRRWSVLLTF